MKILRWIFEFIFEDNFSYFEFTGIVLISAIAGKYSDWWLLLLFPLYFINGFINGLLKQEESRTYYFDTVEESTKFIANNLKEIKSKTVIIKIKELMNPQNN